MRRNLLQVSCRRRSMSSQAVPRHFGCYQNMAAVFDSLRKTSSCFAYAAQKSKSRQVSGDFYFSVRRKGIEPLSPAWKAGILPLNQHRNIFILLYLIGIF